MADAIRIAPEEARKKVILETALSVYMMTKINLNNFTLREQSPYQNFDQICLA